ncbi:hypothetical protein GCM10011579_066800 [Streptomyces albiflavescens]|uniref:Uncharacterized protein n=1 Tax=Streptomyces albiflavescens TaxID=1623582 RepID=A0A917Y9L1_9ACTN|nr:hypothetical protein GCM10011579_066800 [Streptomyces albiflavescens]
MAADATVRRGSRGSSGFHQRIERRFARRAGAFTVWGIPGASHATNAAFPSGREAEGG